MRNPTGFTIILVALAGLVSPTASAKTEKKMAAADLQFESFLGLRSVTVRGEVIVSGAPLAKNNGPSGAVYVFKKDGFGDWAQGSSSAPCTLGDGYKIPSGGSFKAYPVRCPNNCFDYPNGGIEKILFCKDGMLGISDPTLTADGTVAPYEVAGQYNGYSRCTALPLFNPWPNQPKWGQSANRKTCVKL